MKCSILYVNKGDNGMTDIVNGVNVEKMRDLIAQSSAIQLSEVHVESDDDVERRRLRRSTDSRVHRGRDELMNFRARAAHERRRSGVCTHSARVSPSASSYHAAARGIKINAWILT